MISGFGVTAAPAAILRPTPDHPLCGADEEIQSQISAYWRMSLRGKKSDVTRMGQRMGHLKKAVA
jgi:hypothetical protein